MKLTPTISAIDIIHLTDAANKIKNFDDTQARLKLRALEDDLFNKFFNHELVIDNDTKFIKNFYCMVRFLLEKKGKVQQTHLIFYGKIMHALNVVIWLLLVMLWVLVI